MIPRRCAIYTRKSTEEGLEQKFNSLHAQREACEAFVRSQASEGWILTDGVYDDGGYSGGSMDRPALRRLLDDVAADRIDVVVVYKVDRLTRSLMDFTRIVEALDSKAAAFVSVTQAFNTTSSMGRLTLNVLLSFAQFEREITGERIRDKVAASKAKGFRMGGQPPLGYDIVGGRLTPNADEAVRVRAIFERFLALGSVGALRREGVRSKRWENRKGVMKGGYLMSGGAIRYLLLNPAYRGVTRHKQKHYPDTHPALIEADLWDQVQDRLRRGSATRPKGQLIAQPARYRGLLFDDRGHALAPVHTKRRGIRYRYYISRAKLTGDGTPGTVGGISAGLIEGYLDQRIAPLLAHGWCADRTIEERVTAAIAAATVSDNQILVRIWNPALSAEGLRSADVQARDDEAQTLRLPFYLKRRQGAAVIEAANGYIPPRRLNRALVRAVVLARQWAVALESGGYASMSALARERRTSQSYMAQLLPLAFLAPDLVERILEGRQPPTMTLQSLTRTALPLDWDAQRRLFDSPNEPQKGAGFTTMQGRG